MGANGRATKRYYFVNLSHDKKEVISATYHDLCHRCFDLLNKVDGYVLIPLNSGRGRSYKCHFWTHSDGNYAFWKNYFEKEKRMCTDV